MIVRGKLLKLPLSSFSVDSIIVETILAEKLFCLHIEMMLNGGL